ncbi:Spy/CpxP family protein refolding chaperone [Chitinimonas sp.]|uniref:Spy/CpxP family protein refolding chaperone n=1 Tax=Chitinimonas sp. TaxID=1934313 RepID=UPI0035B38513
MKARLISGVRKQAVVLAFVAGAATALGIGAVASGSMAGLHGVAMHGEADSAGHIDRLMNRLFTLVDASDMQKSQLEPILRQAAIELKPVREQFHGAHQQLLTLLSQDNIDRTAVEALRQQQVQSVDQTSKRLLQLAVQISDVLTPAQRQKLAANIQKMHEHHAPRS